MKRIIPFILTILMLISSMPVYASDTIVADSSDTNPQATDNANSWRYSNGKPITVDGNSSDPKTRSTVPYHPDATRVGIDVSEWQDKIDWEKVKAAGIDFAIIRCGYGNDKDDYGGYTQDDKEFKRNISECERLGIPYGVYIYSYATDEKMALSEAEHVLRLIKGHTLSYPVYYDMEDNSTLKAKNKFPSIANTFCNRIQSEGYAVGVYANLNWWDNYLSDPVFDNWYKWVAQYYTSCQYDKEYAIWQYTSSGKVDGISGNVDMNYLIGYPKNHGSTVEAATRIWGQNRYETSLKIADQLKTTTKKEKFESVIVAYGGNYPDALSGSYLAKVKDAPILLIGKDSTTQNSTYSYIKNNLSDEGKIYLLGGEAVIPKSFANKLNGYSVTRLGGKTRYDTNLAILRESGANAEEIMVCSGNGYADSLSASAVGKPILLVNKALTSTQRTYLASNKPNKLYIIGGPAVVNNTVNSQLKSYGSVSRIYGADRYKTSIDVANTFFKEGAENAYLAYAKNFPDGLCAGPLAQSGQGPLLLFDNTHTLLARQCVQNLGIKQVITLGGPSIISDSAITNIIK